MTGSSCIFSPISIFLESVLIKLSVFLIAFKFLLGTFNALDTNLGFLDFGLGEGPLDLGKGEGSLQAVDKFRSSCPKLLH